MCSCLFVYYILALPVLPSWNCLNVCSWFCLRIFHSFEDVIIVSKGLQNQPMLDDHGHCPVRILYHVHAAVTRDLIIHSYTEQCLKYSRYGVKYQKHRGSRFTPGCVPLRLRSECPTIRPPQSIYLNGKQYL